MIKAERNLLFSVDFPTTIGNKAGQVLSGLFLVRRYSFIAEQAIQRHPDPRFPPRLRQHPRP